MAIWNQIKADVLGVPVVRVAGDSTAAGSRCSRASAPGSTPAAEAVAAG